MPERKDKPAKGANRTAPTQRRQKRTDAAPERPPESAENFEHTLRRLIIEKNTQSEER